ncbi:hypothetical protein LTR53_006503 [Teratosphaeriaceae sp. CCFEE 6253]|nr:hypothetical protein LTR53_006503 [Teratosphaeriaceae sp. CCFEE 6253]
MTSPSSAARLIISGLAALSCFFGNARCASAAEWRSRSIYQVVTDRFAYGDGSGDSTPPPCAVINGLYCGGTWHGIRSKLDYIQGMNFDAIWISPVVAQLPQMTGDGMAYTAYWQQDLYALNPNFGTADDLRQLISDIHARGMLIMLDIVVKYNTLATISSCSSFVDPSSHMAYAGPGWDVDHRVLNPFNNGKYYHDYCTVDDPTNQTNTQECYLGDWKVTLADLRTEDPDVRDMFGEWISQMVSNYSIDGLRIDTAINVEPSFFPDFVDSAGVFATGEVMQGDNSLACRWADAIGSILNYPIYYTLTRAFQNSEGSIDDLVATIESAKMNCQDTTTLGSFSENHDVPRFANYTDDMALAQNIIAYTILADGIPIIYQGQEQHMNGDVNPYVNRAPLWAAGYDTSALLYQHIATLNRFRQHAVRIGKRYTTYMNEVIYQDLHSLAMRKGHDGKQVITVLNNNGVTAAYFLLEITGHGFSPGTHLTEVLTCTDTTVNGSGYLNVPMFAGTPKVLYPTDLLEGSALCGRSDGSETTPRSTTSTEAVTTTMHGHPTILSTVHVSPVPATTTSPPDGTASPSRPTHTHKALGHGHVVAHNLPMVLAAAVGATVASAGYLAAGDLLDAGQI